MKCRFKVNIQLIDGRINSIDSYVYKNTMTKINKKTEVETHKQINE